MAERRRRGGASNSLWISSKVAPGGAARGGEEVGGEASWRLKEVLKCANPPSLQVAHNNGEDAASTRVTTDNEPGSVGREEETVSASVKNKEKQTRKKGGIEDLICDFAVVALDLEASGSAVGVVLDLEEKKTKLK